MGALLGGTATGETPLSFNGVAAGPGSHAAPAGAGAAGSEAMGLRGGAGERRRALAERRAAQINQPLFDGRGCWEAVLTPAQVDMVRARTRDDVEWLDALWPVRGGV